MTNIDINNFKTLTELEAYRKSINEALDARAGVISLCNRASELGERSFLFIKNSFESMAPALFESKDGKKILNKYKEVMRSSNNLKNLHALCENIRKADKSVDSTYFVNSITECNWNVDSKTLSNDLSKLGRVLSEAYILLGDDAEKYLVNENRELSNAIEYIAENEKTYKNITEYSTAAKIIRENIESVENEGSLFEEKTLSDVADKMIMEFNKKYDSELDELEKELVKEVAENPDKKSIFEKYKKNCLIKIQEKKECSKANGNNEEFDRLSTITEQVSKKSFSEEKFSDDVCSLVKMLSILA